MKDMIAEKLWNEVSPILQTRKTGPGRAEFDNCKAFFGILYVLENRCKWGCLPEKYGHPSTVHGKFMKWTRAGLIKRIHATTRKKYSKVSKAFKNWLAVDTSTAKAPYAAFAGKNSTDRGKHGIKKNMITDSKGAPLVVSIGSASPHDSKTLMTVVNLLKELKNPKALSILAADSAYDDKKLRKATAELGIVLHAATNKRRSKNKPIIKPKGRWIVEASHSWLNNFRSIKICYAKLKESALAFLQLAASIQLSKMTGIFG